MAINPKEEKAKDLLGCEMLLVDPQKKKYCAAFEDRLEFGIFKAFKMIPNGNPPQTVYYDDIADVVVAHGGILHGRFSIEKKGQQGADSGGIEFGSRPYMVVVSKKHNEVGDRLREYILEKVKSSKPSGTSQVSDVSVADELKKFSDLKDQGILTEEEFDAKKKELLGL